jgi:hypothetical protein
MKDPACSRLPLLSGIAEKTQHARQQQQTNTPMHGNKGQANTFLLHVSYLFKE